jgi:hypothetical protein
MSSMVPMQHPKLPDQPIEVLPEQVPAFEDSGWATDDSTADAPTPVPPVADPAEPYDVEPATTDHEGTEDEDAGPEQDGGEG